VAFAGTCAYVAGSAGLHVISVADPAHPSEVGYHDAPDRAWGLAVAGSYAYIAAGEAGLRVISVADPTHPSEVGYYDTPDYAYGVAVSGDYAYVADFDAGLQICQFYGGGVQETMNDERATMNAVPTIVRGSLRMEDRGLRTEDRAELLDAAGRKVAELHAGANDVSGLSPGVYFAREARAHAQAQAQAVRKVIITR